MCWCLLNLAEEIRDWGNSKRTSHESAQQRKYYLFNYFPFLFFYCKNRNPKKTKIAPIEIGVKTSGKSSRSQQRWARGRSQQQLLKIIHNHIKEIISLLSKQKCFSGKNENCSNKNTVQNMQSNFTVYLSKSVSPPTPYG